MTAMQTGALMEFGEKKALQAATGSAFSAVTTYLALITAAPTITDLTMAAYSPSIEYATATGYARATYSAGTPAYISLAGPPTTPQDHAAVIGNGVTLTYGPFISAPTNNPCTWAILTDTASTTAGNAIAAFLLANSRSPLAGDSLQAAAYAGTGTTPGFTIQV